MEIGIHPSSFPFLFLPDYGYGSEEGKKLAAGYSPDAASAVPTTGGHVSGSSMSQAPSVHTNLLTSSCSTGTAGTPTTVCYEYSYPDSNSNHSKSAAATAAVAAAGGVVRPASEHHYEQPMVVFARSNLEDSSVGKPSRSSAEETATGTTTSRGSTQPDRGGWLIHPVKGGRLTSLLCLFQPPPAAPL